MRTHSLIKCVIKMILEDATKEAFGYFSNNLRPKSKKPILAACEFCGKLKVATKKDYRCFCRSCSHILGEKKKGAHPSKESRKKMGAAHKGERAYNWQGGLIECKCKACGAIFFARRDKLKKGQRLYCSTSCGKMGSNNPNWIGGLMKRKCQVCGTLFYAQRWHVKRGRSLFCSKSCARKARVFPTHHTKPERIFEDISKRNNLPFHYVGDGQLWIGKKGDKQLNPDFVEINGRKICVEVMGDYWHSPLLRYDLRKSARLDYRKKHYKHYRWHPIFIWESDLLREDAEAFVLKKLDTTK